jgi:hypothetical protein
MPFDFLPAETRTLTLAELSRVLRNPQEWPKGFTWDYSRCETCAMGLAFRLLDKTFPPDMESLWIGASEMRARLGLSVGAAENLFFGGLSLFRDGVRDLSDITPIHVADAIDAYLAGGRGKEA